MAVDQDRLRSLLSRAAFDCRFYEGHIQDKSAAQRAMAFVGAPTWGRVGGVPCLTSAVGADGTTSAAIASILDITGTVTFESLSAYPVRPPRWIGQTGATGGYTFGSPTAPARAEVYLLDAAGAGARVVSVVAPPLNRPTHVVITSIAGGTAGLGWVNGIPAAVTLLLAGVAANPPASAVLVASWGAGAGRMLITRAWQGALSNEDCQCLAEQAKLLVGGSW